MNLGRWWKCVEHWDVGKCKIHMWIIYMPFMFVFPYVKLNKRVGKNFLNNLLSWKVVSLKKKICWRVCTLAYRVSSIQHLKQLILDYFTNNVYKNEWMGSKFKHFRSILISMYLQLLELCTYYSFQLLYTLYQFPRVLLC